MRISRLIFASVALPTLLAASDAPPDIDAGLRDRVVRLAEGRLAASALPPETRLVAFYFGASWCGPCRAFVPDLRRAYPRLRASSVEIVFVSDDRDCRRMADYVRSSRMPWLSVGCRHRERLGWLLSDRGAALPGLLVYDRSGQLRATSWSPSGRSFPARTLAELERLANRPE